MAVVSTLRVAPVKGLATVSLPKIELDPAGSVEDRRLFLIDADGAVITLRSHPTLVRVLPDLDLAEGRLRITLPDDTTSETGLEDAAEPVTAQLFGKDRVGRVLPGDVAHHLSAYAGTSVRVVLADDIGTGWDEGPVSILGSASAAAVGGPDQDLARFRMLIELQGTEPFEEDSWVGSRLRIGTARIQVVQSLARCVVITQSPATGATDWDGLHALAQLRGRDNLCLGVIGDVATSGTVTVGDEVVLEAAA